MREFFTPLYPPLAQILTHNRFPVNPWFTMNHGCAEEVVTMLAHFQVSAIKKAWKVHQLGSLFLIYNLVCSNRVDTEKLCIPRQYMPDDAVSKHKETDHVISLRILW